MTAPPSNTLFLPAHCRDTSGIASRLLAAEPALLSSGDFGAGVCQGDGGGPAIIIGDQSAIPLFPQVSPSRLDYRMALLAGSGDSVVVQHRDDRFERYMSRLLGHHHISFLSRDGAKGLSTRGQALLPGPLQDALIGFVTGKAGVTVKPYLTTGHTWRLGHYLAQAARQPVSIAGPTPRTAQRANDKLWFTALARAALGHEATPPTMSAFGPAAAAGLVSYLAKRSKAVVVKVPDSAGAVGNVSLASTVVRQQSLAQLRAFLLTRLRATGWQDRYPVLVGVWDADVSASPSAQIWVPLPQDGPPQLLGLFEQHVRGDAGAFVGAARAALPGPLQDSLAQEALCLAAVLQRIGYFGQCSLDAVICQQDHKPQIHWIECNGRWGGVSIPLQLAQRLTPNTAQAGLLIVQEIRHDMRRVSTADYLDTLDDLLAGPDAPTEGIIVLSPPQADRGVMLNWLVLAGSQEAAIARATAAVARLTTELAPTEGMPDG